MRLKGMDMGVATTLLQHQTIKFKRPKKSFVLLSDLEYK
jgi:hypothetical protein